jgi:hypothetical protein
VSGLASTVGDFCYAVALPWLALPWLVLPWLVLSSHGGVLLLGTAVASNAALGSQAAEGSRK